MGNQYSLREAIESGNNEAIKQSLQAPEITQDEVREELLHGCLSGKTELIKVLVSNGAKVNLQDKDGWSALMCASQNGHYEVAKILLENGAKVDLQKEDGWSALMSASRNGHGKIVKLLLQNRAKVNLQQNYGQSALMIASPFGQSEIVKILLEKGAKVNMQDEDGWSALMSASQNGHTEISEILLENGAEVDLQEKHGWCALMSASDHGRVDIVNTLLRKGAKVDLREINKLYEVSFTCKKKDDIMKILEHCGAAHQLNCCPSPIRYKCNEIKPVLSLPNGIRLQQLPGYCSPIIIRNHAGHDEVIRLLQEKGASMDAVQQNKLPVVMEDHNLFYEDFLDESLKLEINIANVKHDFELQTVTKINVHSDSGYSALTLASQYGRCEIVKKLLEKGAEINEQMNNGMTSLMLASQNGHADVVRVLLQHGAQVNLGNIHNQTALMLATEARDNHLIYFIGKLSVN